MSTSAILDCSVVVDLLVSDDRRLLMSNLPAGIWHAPHLLDIELVSALRGRHLGGHLTAPRIQDALLDFADLSFSTWPAGPAMRSRIFAVGGNLTAYDAAYVVLAEALDLPLITRDRQLAATAGHWGTVHTL